MAITKSSATLQASATNAAGGTTTSSVAILTAVYGGVLTAQVTNGGTTPTLPCSVRVEKSANNTNWFTWEQATAGLVASQVYSFGWEIPWGIMYIRVVFTGNTGQSVTIAAQIEYITAI